MAMIAGDSPLNIENAWMRFPIFIQLANIHFQQQNYFYAAKALRKAALISEIYNNNEFYIHCEQTAYLFSKINLYLEAAKILENVDRKKSEIFKKQYHDLLIFEGTKLFNNKKYENAAIQYENAGQWALIELEIPEIVQKSFELAINSWISVCKCDKAFKLLERLPHKQIKPLLLEISNKILNAVDYLISIGDLGNARDQLYFSIYTYQKEGLFDDLKRFTDKQIDVLIKTIDQEVNKKDGNSAKKAYDEIENLWESYQLKRNNLDNSIEKIVKLFIELLNFNLASLMINKIESLDLKQKLTDLSSEAEELEKESRKKEIEDHMQQGINLLQEFITAELNIIAQLNTQVLEEADKFKQKNEFTNAAKMIKNQSIFLINLGKEEIAHQILIKALDMLIEARQFDIFFRYFLDLSVEDKKDYLKRVFPFYIEKIKEFKEKESYEKNENVFEMSCKIFRNSMLYEESKELSRLFIKMIKKEALRIIEAENNLSGIEKATHLIKKIDNILSAYFDKDEVKVKFNKIYKKIAEIYISMEDFASAQIINDKIEKPEYKSEIHKKLAKLETFKMAVKSKQIEESIKGEFLKERLSIIKRKAQDALHDKQNDLKQRTALKRAYLKDAIDALMKQDLDKAIYSYKDSIIRLNRKKEYNLAGVSLAVASLLYIREKKIREINTLIEEINKELSTSKKFFSETFPVILIEYILEMEKIQDEPKFKVAISYLENLPLFEEEIEVLYEYIGKKYEKEHIIEILKVDAGEITKIRSEIKKLAGKIMMESEDMVKRKMMKREYWNNALDELIKKNFNEAVSRYIESYFKLNNKRFFKHAAIGLILSTIILLKEEDILNAKTFYVNNLNDLKILKTEFDVLPEIQLIQYLFISMENNLEEIRKMILNSFATKLILFEPEIDFLNAFIGAEMIKEGNKEILPEKESIELTKIKRDLDLIVSTLQQKVGDLKTESKDFLSKRTAMRKRSYEDILNLLKKQRFKEASDKYFELANTLVKRKDYQTSALLILLYGLSALKAQQTLAIVKDKVNSYLDSLGLSKSLVKETFYISLLLLILDSKIEHLTQYKSKIDLFLSLLPMFEEEKDLTLIN
jgi:hypothetical protein